MTTRLAISLLPAWHSVPGGTWVALRETFRTVHSMQRTEGVGAGIEFVGVTAAGPPAAQVDVPFATTPLRSAGPFGFGTRVWTRRTAYLAWAAGFGPSVERSADADVTYLGAPAVPPRSRGPVVITLHDLFPLSRPEWFTRVGAIQMRRAISAARRHADAVIVSSEATRREAEAAGFDPERLTVVPLAVSCPDDDTARRELRQRVRARLRLPEHYVAWIGTDEPRKGLGLLLDAWVHVERQLPDVELVLAGPSGWGSDSTHHGRPRVRHLGRLSDEELDAVLAGAGLFVFPSHAEGFGLPPLEAMARGVPPLVASGGACAEVVGDDELLVEDREPIGWARRIVATWQDKEFRAIKSTAVARRARLYSWDRTARAVIAVIEGTL